MPRGKIRKVRESIYERPGRLPRTLYESGGDAEKGLQSAMGLGADRPTFMKYIAIMDKSAERSFPDPSLLLTKQPLANMQAFMKRATRHMPLLDSYEDCWPASAYIRIWLRQKMAHGRSPRGRSRSVSRAPRGYTRNAGKTKAKRQKPRQQEKRTAVHVIKVEDSLGTQDAAPSGSSRGAAFSATQPSSRTSTQTASRAACASSGSSRSTASSATLASTASRTSTTGPKSCSSRTIAAAAAPDGAGPGDSLAPVREFLRTLAQPLECLLPALRELGVRDMRALRSIVRTPGWVDWLRHKLVYARGVGELQCFQLTVGLRARFAMEEEP